MSILAFGITNMKNADKVTMSFGQLKKLVRESIDDEEEPFSINILVMKIKTYDWKVYRCDTGERRQMLIYKSEVDKVDADNDHYDRVRGTNQINWIVTLHLNRDRTSEGADKCGWLTSSKCMVSVYLKDLDNACPELGEIAHQKLKKSFYSTDPLMGSPT